MSLTHLQMVGIATFAMIGVLSFGWTVGETPHAISDFHNGEPQELFGTLFVTGTMIPAISMVAITLIHEKASKIASKP